MAQSGKPPTSAQVMISQFRSWSPASGSALTARPLEPVSDSVSPFLSAPPLLVLCLCLSLKNKHFKKYLKKKNKLPSSCAVSLRKMHVLKVILFCLLLKLFYNLYFFGGSGHFFLQKLDSLVLYHIIFISIMLLSE